MAERRDLSFIQHRSPSFSQAAHLTSTLPGSTPPRPSTKRSVSGSANLGPLSSFSTISGPSQTSGEPIVSPAPPDADSTTSLSRNTALASSQHRSATASASAFGMSKIDQSAWSDAAANNGSPSSVWNGRPPPTMDGDAVTTASTSNVSTPGRGPNALDGKEVSAKAPIFTPSPLLPGEGSAWSVSRTASLTWANDLAAKSTPTDIDTAASSPSAVKRTTGDASSSPSASRTVAAVASPGDTAASSSISKTAAPVPKRGPIRAATLDPRALASNRRPSQDLDDDSLPSGQPGEAGDDDELTDEMGTLSIATGDAASTQQLDYNAPPALMGPGNHMQRPSGSYPPPPFSPGEAFMHPSPYLPGSGARSPDGYTLGYPGVTHMLPGMTPMDMSGYESYRTTPDPYAPTMPGRAIFASPGSQGSTPQSPSFGPTPLGPQFNASMRNGEAMFYPGAVPGFGPPQMVGGMASPVRPGMLPGPPQYGYGPGPSMDGRPSQLGQSPMMAPGMAMPMAGLMMPPASPSMNSAQMTPGGPDSRSSSSLSQSSPYIPGPHRRMGSSGSEPFGPGMTMSPRPPFAMNNQAGPFIPGQHSMHGMMGGTPMHGGMMGWNGRFHDHRRVPTGPGGVMAPVGGYGGGPMDPNHFARNGGGFYGGPFHPATGHSGPGGPSSNGSSHPRSPLLEEFRSRHGKNRKFELSDIYGSVVEFSGDQHGSRFIQEKLDLASDEEKKTLFDEVLPHARQLMTDVFGNYVIQKMLEHGNDEQRDVLSREMEGHILPLSLGTYGCRVVQKAFDHISHSQREKLALELNGHIMQCVRDQNANHVVQKIIERVDADKIDFIPKAFLGHVPSLASHCYSCRVLQRTFEHCNESQVRPLLDELHAEAYTLMQHQYGNYVIQWVLQRGQPRDREEVIGKIKGSILTLSRHKFASNVIEEVVRTSNKADFDELLEEILTKGGEGEVEPAVLMMKDQFANYVLQRFLEQADGGQRGRLVDVLMPGLVASRKGGPGVTKHLAAIERLIETLQTEGAAAGGGEGGAVADA